MGRLIFSALSFSMAAFFAVIGVDTFVDAAILAVSLFAGAFSFYSSLEI